jgi:Holliday junction resolvasome RuvABC endonuclease subunit
VKKIDRYTTPTVYESEKLPNSDKLYVGIDQSLTCTSVAFLQNGRLEIYRIIPKVIGVKRLAEIKKKFDALIEEKTIDGAAIEGYAMAAKGRVFNLGEVGGVLRLSLFSKAISSIEVPPTVLKKYGTEKGNSPKEVMIKALETKYGFVTDDDNDSDAVHLAIACFEYFETTYHFLANYRTYIQATSAQIIGDHPKPLDVDKYCEELGDMRVGDFEKAKRGGKPKKIYRKHQLK